MTEYLSVTQFFDYQDQAVQTFAQQILGAKKRSPVETAIRLYYAVRDEIRYNPYVFSFDLHTFSASHCLQQRESYCIPKAVLLGSLARLCGIPARLGLADVKNHLSSQKLRDFLQTDLFVMHGYIELYLENKWVKATPAFNASLCEKLGVAPLEFDGLTDSVFQPYNQAGGKHMEYVKEHGHFQDVPVSLIQQTVLKTYPHLTDPGLISGRTKQTLENDFIG